MSGPVHDQLFVDVLVKQGGGGGHLKQFIAKLNTKYISIYNKDICYKKVDSICFCMFVSKQNSMQ